MTLASENNAAVISAEIDTVSQTLKKRIELMDKNNNGNRSAISVMYLREGAVFLGKINLSKGKNTDDILTLYSGQQIYNFDFDFCIPAFDRLIIELIAEWNASNELHTIKAIYKRIEILRGVVLCWM